MSPRTGWSPRWCRRRASTRSVSARTSRTRTRPVRPRRSASWRASRPASAGRTPRVPPNGVPRLRQGEGGQGARRAARCLPRRRLRRRQDAPPGVPVARHPGRARPQGVRHLRRADQPGRRPRLPADGADPLRAPAAVHRRVRAGRPGRHRARLDAARQAGRRGRRARRHLQHPARQARRGPVRVRRLPARDPGPVGALPRAAHRRRGLPPPRPARGAGCRTPTNR